MFFGGQTCAQKDLKGSFIKEEERHAGKEDTSSLCLKCLVCG